MKWWRRPKQVGPLQAAEISAILIALALFASSGLVGGTTAALTAQTNNPGNVLSTKSDWAAPTTSGAKIVNSLGNLDYLRPADTYQVCSNVTDAGGNPPSGVSSASVNLAVAANVLTTGATSVALPGGAFTCGGAAYNRRSATQTANVALTAGTKAFQVTSTDVAGNAATTSWTVTIDNTGPSPSTVTTSNGGTTVGKMEAGDSLSITLSETTIDLNRILVGWSGASTSAFVKVFNNNANFGGNDGLAICQANTASCGAAGTDSDNILGRVNLGRTDYVPAAAAFNATLAWNAGTGVLTVTLGGCISGCASVGTSAATSTATFTPIDGSLQAGGVRDLAGNGATATATETGKKHF